MFDLSGTGLLALRYIPVPPGFEGVADAVVSIFDDSVCWTFLNGGCIFILAIFVALLMDGNRLIAIKKGKRNDYMSNEKTRNDE